MNGYNDSAQPGNRTIAVILGEPTWTAKAIHLACALAQNRQGRVILVKMIPVQHPLALGTPTGYVNLSIAERQAAYEWRSVAQAYGAACSLCLYQYASYLSGVVSAAEQMEATIVLAEPRPSMLPVWGKFQEWRLRKALANQGCSLETLALPDQGSDPVPYINLVTGSKPSSSGK